MKKSEKSILIEDLQEKIKKSGATFVAEYQGIEAVQMNELRKSLRDASIDFKVVRNTLARRAVKGTPIEFISKDLVGPTAIAFSYKDAAGAAKALVEFARTQPKLKLRIGALGAKVMSVDDIKALASLPSRDVLLGMLLGTMKSPVSGFARVLGGVPTKLLYALNAIKDSKTAQA